MRMTWKAFLATAAPLAIGTAGAAGVHRNHARPKVLCGLPDRPYTRALPPTLPALAVSQVAVLLRRAEVPPPADPGERVAYFQLNQARVQLGHCSIAQVVLSVRENGAWTLNFRAD